MATENTNYVLYLIERSQAGVRNSFFDLCEINLHTVFNISYHLLSTIEAAKKNALDTFFHVWETIKDFNSQTSFVLWLKELTVKYAIFEMKRNGLSYSYKPLINPSSDPHELLEQMIKCLPDEDRIILILHDMEDYTFKEIMNFLPGLSQDEIKSKLINAREYLISKL